MRFRSNYHHHYLCSEQEEATVKVLVLNVCCLARLSWRSDDDVLFSIGIREMKIASWRSHYVSNYTLCHRGLICYEQRRRQQDAVKF
jgi:hypothetical protein